VTLPGGALVTNVAKNTIVGKTVPLATVALETGTDSLFDEGTTTADASGNYALPVTLAEGANTLQVRATSNGQQTTQTIRVTLDTIPPAISVSSPAPGLVTKQNVTIAGQVTDGGSGVASLQAALDNGTLTPVSLGSNGTFSFTTSLALNGTADGPHTERLKTTDNAGNVSTFDVSFTLDTVAPTIAVTSPPANLITDQNVTIVGQVTDTGSGVASLQAALDNGTLAPVSLGSSGSFSFATALVLNGTADGPHTEHLKATDNAGNVSTLDVTFTLDTVSPTIDVFSPPPNLITNQNVTITGQVTDGGSGVASLQAALDNGTLAPVSLGSGGSFSFAINLSLNGTADGPHTEHLKATDNAGNVSTLDVTFTLDTVPPTITVSSPAPGLVTNHNVTITGQVTDDRSGVASLQAALDNGAFTTVTVGSGGAFSLATALALDGSADGAHAEHLKASDNAGNVSSIDVSFTLDTSPPAVDFGLDPAFDTPPIGDGHTQFATVTLTGTTEPDIAVVLEPTGASTTSDANGGFSFTGVALALGANTFTVQATDQVGNTGTVQHTITRDPVFDVTLVEGTQLLTTNDQTFAVPAAPSVLQFKFGDLKFDTSSPFINDAFEASLTDADGNSLVLPIAGSRDAFLNISAAQAPVLSPNAQVSGGTVDVDLSHIPAGTQAQLEVRLVNNDSDPDTDTNTTVGIDKAQIIAQTMNTPAAVTPAVAVTAAANNIDFSALADVSTSMTATYGQTSFNQQSGVLYAGLTVQNTGTYPVDAPLVAVITHLSDPSIRVRGKDGVTPDGLPYFDLSGLIGSSTLAVGQSTGTRTLSFYDHNHTQFTYDLKILGQLNRPPAFTSQPNTEAIPGVPYVYQATASDPDNDPLTFSLLIGPAGITVDATSGKVTWSPQQGDLGNETVLLQVDDAHGGTAQQQYTVSTIVAPPNRPPVFTSTPPVDGNVKTAYAYQATAGDPDGNTLSFSVVSGPQGLTIDPASGLVAWSPTANQLGANAVTLQVSDGRGGTANQSYVINVQQQVGDQPPVIVSQPVTTLPVAGNYTYPVRAIDPDGDPLTYSLTAAAPGMTIDANTGLVQWNASAGDALQFSGSSYAVTPDLTSYLAKNVITLELWFNANQPGVLVDGLSSNNPQTAIIHTSQIEIVGSHLLGRVGSMPPIDLGFVSFGVWHHLALRYDRSANVLAGFLDGVKSASATESGQTLGSISFFALGAGDTSNLGNHALGSGAFFNGQLDEFRVWNVARTDSQITSDVHQPLTSGTPGLVAYYHFDEGTGTIAHDSSGQGNNVTLNAVGTGSLPAWVASGPLFAASSYPITVRVDDGRGGFDTQSYTLNVVLDQSGSIEGTVFNDLNGNGSRDPINVPPTPAVPLLTVPGTADPYLAGMPSGATADAGDSAPAESPFQVPGLTLAAGSSLMFTVPAGTTGVSGQEQGPDGLANSHEIHAALNGISGMNGPQDSLVGVFLGPDLPDQTPAPGALDFNSSDPNSVPGGIDYLSLAPALKQVFFIGDGRTGTGQVQQIVVPAGATRLFLATFDKASWNGHVGSLAVAVQPFDATSAPRYPDLVPIAIKLPNLLAVTVDQQLNRILLGVNFPTGSP
jgi:hypothetical protein